MPTHPSQAPSRAMRGFHTTQASKPSGSNCDPYAPSLTSPQGSQDEGYTPPGTTDAEPSYTLSPTVENPQMEDPSMVAVHGSSLPSPILQARRRGLKSSFFVMGREGTQEWDAEKRQEEELAKPQTQMLATTPEEDPFRPCIKLPAQWTPTSGRVIAIDADLVYPQAQIDLTHPDAGLNGETHLVDNGMRLMTDDTPIMSPAEVKGALSGARLALKHLRELGHPLHLVANRPATDRPAVALWLENQGITIGTGDNDLIAALWFIDPIITPPLNGDGVQENIAENVGWKRDKEGEARLKVLRVINAALFISSPSSTSQAIRDASSNMSIIVLGQRDTAQATSPTEPMTDFAKPTEQIKNGSGTGIPVTDKWRDVVVWVKAWDEA